MPEKTSNKSKEYKIKRMRFNNFKVFENYELDFTRNGVCKDFVCFIGPNGCGKTTILDGTQNLFGRYDSYTVPRLAALLGKCVRHVTDENFKDGVHGDANFLIEADIQCPTGDYTVQLTKNGFVHDHPEKLREHLSKLCFYARFDQELHQFQLKRDKWVLFKDLFEAVTGFNIEEIDGFTLGDQKFKFNDSGDPRQAKIMKEYVLGFLVHKPHETITHKECSAGERKIVKCFSTLLSKDYTPSIILVDNVAMHIESGRHLQMIESIKRCFPTSQIFATTHSYHISKNLGTKDELYDLRLIKAPPLVKNNPWRLYCIDEIKDALFKLKAMETSPTINFVIEQGESLWDDLVSSDISKHSDLLLRTKKFLAQVESLFVDDLFNYHNQQ